MEREISISFSNVYLPAAINQLIRQSKVRFSYNSNIIPKGERITRTYTDTSLKQILDDLLMQANLFYKEISGNILINKRVFTNRQLRGRIVENGSPLPFAHVFIDNSMVGTSTEVDGTFVIDDIPNRAFDVVVSYLGYEPYMFSYSYEKAASGEDLVIELKLDEPKQLESVVVKPRKTQRKENKILQRFMSEFLGQGDNSKKCRIENPDVFEVDTDFNVPNGYRITANDVIYIDNKALGYRVSFYLEEFVFINGAQSTKGTANFEELEPKSRKQNRRWEAAREKAYKGSLSHFLNSMIKDNLTEQGFQINTVQFDSVTSEYYSTTLNGLPLEEVLTLEQINEAGKYKLKTNSDIEVTYTKAYESSDYVKRFRSKSKNLTYKYTDRKSISRVKLGDNQSLNSHLDNIEISSLQLFQTSVILFNNSQPIINAPGGFSDEEDVKYLGWWNWGGISEILPFDYKPKSKKN